MGEYEAFGAVNCQDEGVIYSRALLDSWSELIFLRDTLGLKADNHMGLLDIGSGYGRLLYRWNQMFPQATGVGVDGVPLSTYLCDCYLRFRQRESHLTSLPLN